MLALALSCRHGVLFVLFNVSFRVPLDTASLSLTSFSFPPWYLLPWLFVFIDAIGIANIYTSAK